MTFVFSVCRLVSRRCHNISAIRKLVKLAPSGRTLIVMLLHRTTTQRTGDDGKRPYHDIFDLGLMFTDTATIAVPAALADAHPGLFLGRELLGVHTVLA
jgi:hypothetical protein